MKNIRLLFLFLINFTSLVSCSSSKNIEFSSENLLVKENIVSITIKEDDYVSKWFVISFISNIARMAVLDENDIKAQPHLLERQANLAKFIIFIWKHSSPETFVPPTTANTNIEEAPNIVEENLPPIPEI